MKTNLRLEDGRIGEQPEVIYHVFHTLLFGGLALLFDGYVHLQHAEKIAALSHYIHHQPIGGAVLKTVGRTDIDVDCVLVFFHAG